jgi:prophage regulatory protein
MVKRLLRLPAVIDRTGSNASDIYSGMKAGTFPTSVPIGRRTVGWVEEEIEQWISDRIAARDQPNKRKGGPGRGHKGRIHAQSNSG